MRDDAAEKKIKLKNSPYISAAFVVINVIVYIMCTIRGDMLYNKGSISALDLYTGEVYRLVTSMFLHADTVHLFNNMILLFGIGNMLENELGHIRFGVYCLLGGLGGSFLSIVHQLITGRFVSSIGASGIVFGLVGVLLALTFFSRKKIETVTAPRILIMIVLSLYSGFTAPNIDNEAHIGGLLTGFVLGILFCVRQKILKAIQRRKVS